MYIEFRCLERKKKKRLEVQKRPKEATSRLRVWVTIKVFFVATELFGSMSRHGSLCRDRGFPGRDGVVFFWFSVTTGVLLVLRQCFVLFRDNVATKGPLSQSRWPRQEVRVATGAWLRPRNFRSRHKILVSR